MKILIAPDSFKECMSAYDVASALARGVCRSGISESSVILRPLADGGDGLLDVMLYALKGEICHVRVCGPMGKKINVSFGLFDDGRTAVIEMAKAAGLHLVPPGKRIPGVATTFGVGELIRHALDCDVQKIILGLGGSATNDGGTGMAAALGVRFNDSSGRELPPGGASLQRLDAIDTALLDPRIHGVEVVAACDVTNPLYGINGASRVYGPQKGATPEEVILLDSALQHYAELLDKQCGMSINSIAGSGAAGGLAAGLVAFTHATLRSGVDIVFDAYGDIDETIRQADVVISGEGSVDGQSAQGKVVWGLARKTTIHEKPLLIVAGSVGDNLDVLYDAGVTAVLPIAPGPMPRAAAIKRAALHLESTGHTIGRLIQLLSARH